MELKKKLRDAIAVNRKANKGFTLVELIVVIAILAILAGIAVPAYSGYVKKANMGADQALAADVAKAMQTHYYASNNDADLNDSGYVILKYDAEPEADAYGEQAMVAAFGDGWEDTARLKYDGWTFDGNLFNAMVAVNGSYVAAVPSSSYITGVGTEGLLEDVQLASSQLAEFLVKAQTAFSGVDGATALNKFLGGDAENNYLSVLNGYSGDITEQVLADATVFGIASILNDSVASTDVMNNFSSGYYINRFGTSVNKPLVDDNSTNVLVDAAHTYAALEAYVGYVNTQGTEKEKTEVNKAFNELKAALEDPDTTNSKDAVILAINNCGDTIYNETKRDSLKTYLNGQGAEDGKAYIGIMQTVNGLSSDYKNNLGEEGLFTSDALADRVDSFVATAGDSADLSALSGVSGEILNLVGDDSALVIAFSVDANGVPGCSVLFLNAE